MTREIKFRAWDKKRSQMIDLATSKYALSKNGDDGFVIWHWEHGVTLDENLKDTGHRTFSYFADSLSVVLMQYTGLKDKNGKEIYEGDIMQSPDKTVIYKVYFSEGEYIKESENVFHSLWEFMDDVVIGNIYENPELL